MAFGFLQNQRGHTFEAKNFCDSVKTQTRAITSDRSDEYQQQDYYLLFHHILLCFLSTVFCCFVSDTDKHRLTPFVTPFPSGFQAGNQNELFYIEPTEGAVLTVGAPQFISKHSSLYKLHTLLQIFYKPCE